jgi:5-methylcytosine-specific restriction endonuclease McrA
MTFDSFKRKVEKHGLQAVEASKHWTIKGGPRIVRVYNRLSGISFDVRGSGIWAKFGVTTDDAIRAALTATPEQPPRSRSNRSKGRHRKWLPKLFLYADHCWYCGRTLTTRTATIDHIIPKSKGGKDDFGNLRLACASCNSTRGSSDDIEFRKLRRAMMANRLLAHSPLPPS